MAKRRSKKQIASLYKMDKVVVRKPGETDEKYYKRLAAAADRRLERLENEVYGSVKEATDKNKAYRYALRDIRANTGDETALRFRRSLALNEDGSINKKNLHARINSVKRFLQSPTTTRQGITRVNKVRTTTLNRKYNTNLTPQQAEDVYENAYWKKKTKNDSFASKTIMRTIGVLQHQPEDVDVKKMLEENKTVSKDEVLDAVAKELWKEGKDLLDLFL